MSSDRESGAEGSAQSKYSLFSGNPEAYLHSSGVYPSSIGLSPGASAHSSKINLSSSDGLRHPLHLLPMLPKRVPSRLSMASEPLAIAREEKRAFMRRASAYEERVLKHERSALDAEDYDEDEDMEIERRVNRRLLLGATHR